MSRFKWNWGAMIWLIGMVSIPVYVWLQPKRMLVEINIDRSPPLVDGVQLLSPQVVQRVEAPRPVHFRFPVTSAKTTGAVEMGIKPDADRGEYLQPPPKIYAGNDREQLMTFPVQLGSDDYPIFESTGYDYDIEEIRDEHTRLRLAGGRIELRVEHLPGVDSIWLVGVSLLATFLQLTGAPGLFRLFFDSSQDPPSHDDDTAPAQRAAQA